MNASTCSWTPIPKSTSADEKVVNGFRTRAIKEAGGKKRRDRESPRRSPYGRLVADAARPPLAIATRAPGACPDSFVLSSSCNPIPFQVPSENPAFLSPSSPFQQPPTPRSPNAIHIQAVHPVSIHRARRPCSQAAQAHPVRHDAVPCGRRPGRNRADTPGLGDPDRLLREHGLRDGAAPRDARRFHDLRRGAGGQRLRHGRRRGAGGRHPTPGAQPRGPAPERDHPHAPGRVRGDEPGGVPGYHPTTEELAAASTVVAELAEPGQQLRPGSSGRRHRRRPRSPARCSSVSGGGTCASRQMRGTGTSGPKTVWPGRGRCCSWTG